MATSDNPEAVRKLLEHLQSDLKNISLETKRKHPSVKESAEEAIVKIRNASGSSNTPLAYLSNQILYPLVQVQIYHTVCSVNSIKSAQIIDITETETCSRDARRRTRRW